MKVKLKPDVLSEEWQPSEDSPSQQRRLKHTSSCKYKFSTRFFIVICFSAFSCGASSYVFLFIL